MEVEVSSDVRLYASRFGDLHLVVVWSGRCARAVGSREDGCGVAVVQRRQVVNLTTVVVE